MNKLLVAVLLFAASSLTYAQSDRDADIAGQWDYGSASTDRRSDGGGQLNSGGTGSAGEIDNNGLWDFNSNGTDSNLDNNGEWGLSRAAPIKFSIMTVSGIPTMMVKIGI